jgi:hypothetical protein
LADFKRMVKLYPLGAVMELFHDGSPAHVGFRYDCMSDDDYFELRQRRRARIAPTLPPEQPSQLPQG